MSEHMAVALPAQKKLESQKFVFAGKNQNTITLSYMALHINKKTVLH